MNKSGVGTAGSGNSAHRISKEVGAEMPSGVGLGDSGNVAVYTEAIAARLAAERGKTMPA